MSPVFVFPVRLVPVATRMRVVPFILGASSFLLVRAALFVAGAPPVVSLHWSLERRAGFSSGARYNYDDYNILLGIPTNVDIENKKQR